MGWGSESEKMKGGSVRKISGEQQAHLARPTSKAILTQVLLSLLFGFQGTNNNSTGVATLDFK